MKKIISYFVCFLVLLTFASCGNNDYVGVDKAKQSVVDDIGAALEDVEFAANDLIEDASGNYYDIRFTKDGTEYHYKVDAMDGKILEKSSSSNDEAENETVNNNEVSQSQPDSSSSNSVLDNEETTDNSTSNTNSIENTSNTTKS